MRLLPNGFYTGMLERIDERSARYGAYWQWRFQIYHQGQLAIVSALTPAVLTGKARRYAEALLGRPLERGETFEPDYLHGESCTVEVSTITKNGRSFNSVESLL
jgi:hypothetical protein